MLKWIIIAVLVISGIVMGFLYMNLQNLEKTPSQLPPVEAANTIRVVHSFRDGVHRYAGQIKLPHSCFSISTDVFHDPKIDNNQVILTITTKDNILEQKICSQIPTRYQFDTVADAPEGARLILRIDDEERPVSITETEWTNPTGKVIVK